MSVEATSKTIRSYLDTLVARGNFADYFTDDVSWTTVGGGQELRPTQNQDPGRWRWASSPGGRLGRHPHRRVS